MPNDDYSYADLVEDQNYVSRGEAKKLARDEFQKILTDVNTFSAQARAGVSNAIREVTAWHPDFEERRPQMMAVLQEIPLLRDALNSAEQNPQLSGSLPEMYECLYKASYGPAKSTDTAPSSEQAKATANDLSSEGVQYSAALASQKVDLSPANRKALIVELEKRGVGDIEF